MNEIHFIFITEVVNGRCAEVGIATQEDLNLRPGLSYAIEYTSENRSVTFPRILRPGRRIVVMSFPVCPSYRGPGH